MIDDYFSIERCTSESPQKGIVRVRLNPDSRVYEGHFPDAPVSPGVCNIEMIRRCAEAIHGHELRIRTIKQCRLTTLMTPLSHPQADVRVELQEIQWGTSPNVQKEPGVYRLTASIGEGDMTYLTLKADVSDE